MKNSPASSPFFQIRPLIPPNPPQKIRNQQNDTLRRGFPDIMHELTRRSLHLFRLFYGRPVVGCVLEWIPIRPAEHVPEHKVLSVIVVECSVVDGVVRGAVDVRELERDAVVDVDGPQPDPRERHEVRHVVHGEQKDEDVVRTTLQPAVQGVKRVGGERRRLLVLVMQLVHGRVQQPAIRARSFLLRTHGLQSQYVCDVERSCSSAY